MYGTLYNIFDQSQILSLFPESMAKEEIALFLILNLWTVCQFKNYPKKTGSNKNGLTTCFWKMQPAWISHLSPTSNFELKQFLLKVLVTFY